jgi:hypothetical protein
MLNITLRTLLHVKPFRLIINLVKPLLISTDLELLRLIRQRPKQPCADADMEDERLRYMACATLKSTVS